MTYENLLRLCFSYLRFSRTEQAKGNSTLRQETLRDAYCKRLNLLLDNSRHYEDKGVSGFHGANSVTGHLAEFLDLVKTGQIPPGSVLLIESIDRLSRDQIRAARDLLERILEAGIEVHTLSPERIYNKQSLNDPYALIGLILEFAKAHEFSAQLSTRLRAAWEHKREKAQMHKTPLSKKVPLWLTVVDGKYHVIPDRAKTVILIYELCRDGYGVNLIYKELLKRRIPPFGKKWSESSIMKILMGDAAIGHHTPLRRDPATKKKLASERIDNLFPAVVSETLNAQAKVAMRSRRKRGGRVDYEHGPIHPFMGLLKTHTGVSVRVIYRQVNKTGPNKVAPFLREHDTGNSYPLSHFEFYALGFLCRYEPEPAKKQSGELNEVEETIAKLTYKIQALKDRITSGEDFQSFLELLASAEKQKQEALKRLEQLRVIEALEPISRGLVTIQGLFERLDPGKGHDKIPTNRETDLQLQTTLRKMVKYIEITIGREHRYWQQKSIRVTVTFRDGNRAEFFHRP